MINSEGVLNDILVKIFNNILTIEEKSLKKSSDLKDLSVTEMHTIEAIGIEGARTMSEVAGDLGVTVGTLTTAVTKLIKKGYVNRRRIEEDRRVVLVELTDRGKVAFDIHKKFHDDMIKEVISMVNEEEERILISTLDKIYQYFKGKYHL